MRVLLSWHLRLLRLLRLLVRFLERLTRALFVCSSCAHFFSRASLPGLHVGCEWCKKKMQCPQDLETLYNQFTQFPRVICELIWSFVHVQDEDLRILAYFCENATFRDNVQHNAACVVHADKHPMCVRDIHPAYQVQMEITDHKITQQHVPSFVPLCVRSSDAVPRGVAISLVSLDKSPSIGIITAPSA